MGPSCAICLHDAIPGYPAMSPHKIPWLFPDISLTICGFPCPWDILSAFPFCLNTNFASNLTNHSPEVALNLLQDCAQWQPSELNTLEGHTVLWFLIIFYYLDCAKCEFPDFSQYSFFPWPSTKFPDFSLTFAKSGISLTFPWVA